MFVLSFLFVCCLGVVSAADISVSDMCDDSILNGNVGVSDSTVGYNGNQFNNLVLGNGTSKYNGHVDDGSANGTNGTRSSKNISNSSSNESSFVSCVVSCEDDFKNVSKQFKNLTNDTSCVIVNLTNNIYISHDGFVLNFGCKNKTLVIFGNDYNISVSKPDLGCENHFLNCGGSSAVFMCDVRVSVFNTAINNSGKCIFENVIFDSNNLDYVYEWDVGGAIQNFGDLECYNCSFVNNLAFYGGAIYSNGTFSKVKLSNCIFKNNTAYASESGNS